MIATIKANFVTILSASTIALVLVFVFTTFFGDTYVIRGNIHDLWIPMNAAYALQTGSIPHLTFNSPFGPLYFIFSSNSLALIDAFPDLLNYPDIHFLSTLQYLVILVFVYLAMRSANAQEHRIPLWFLAILIIVSFQTRDIDDLTEDIPNWYGIYNSHLWALIILQAANLYLWQQRKQTNLGTFLLALIHVVILLVALNYKISFAVAIGGLCLAPYLFLGSLRRTILYTFVGIVGVSIGSFLFSVTGFSYPEYFVDIAFVAKSRASGSYNVSELLQTVAIFLFLMQIARNHNSGDFPQESNIFRWWISYLQTTVFTLKSGRLNLYFDLIVAFSLTAARLGDFQTPFFPFALILFFVMFGPYSKASFFNPVKRNVVHYVAFYWVLSMTLANIMTLHRVAENRNSTEDRSAPRARFLVPTIEAPRNTFSFRFSPEPSINEALNDRLIAKSQDWNQLLFDASYSQFSERRWSVLYLPGAFGNGQYVDNLNEVRSWFEERELDNQSIKIAANGFANPWPFLSGNKFPSKTMHWVHIGTTIAYDDLEPHFETFNTADLIVVPLLGEDNSPAQFYLNCSFYLWNIETGNRFIPQEVVGTSLVMAREGSAVPLWAEPPVTIDAEKISYACSRLRSFFSDQ